MSVLRVLKFFVKINRNLSARLLEKYPDFYGAKSYKTTLEEKIADKIASGLVDSVLEVGGIDRPLLAKGHGFAYDGLDVESCERCYEIYDSFFVQSIETSISKKYDLIISITLLEHVRDNASAMKSMLESLNSEGEMLHFVPSKWHPYSISLRLVGHTVQKALIPILRPGAESVSGYRAFFDKCSVPSMRRLLRRQGFRDVKFQTFYHANDYFAFFTPLYVLVTVFENLCEALDWEIFASGFIVRAKKCE